MAKLDKLITYAYLREEVDIPQNIPDSELEHPVYRGQEMLRMLMGDEFYKDFLTNYRANSFSAAYEALYSPYIKQFIAWQAKEYWTVRTNFKPTRSGYRVHSEENSVVATDTQMATLIKDDKQLAQYYKTLLVDFLNGNASVYTLYNRSCNRNLSGNTLHISAVKKKHNENCKCDSCRC